MVTVTVANRLRSRKVMVMVTVMLTKMDVGGVLGDIGAIICDS